MPLLLGRQLGRPGPAPARQRRGLRARRLRRRSGSRCTASSTGPHFYTDYGVGLQKQFFGHFLKGEDTGWDRAAAGPAAGAPPRARRSSNAAESEWPLARTEWTALLPRLRRRRRSREPQAEAAAARPTTRPATGSPSRPRRSSADTEITGPSTCRLVDLLEHRGRRRLRRPAGLTTPRAKRSPSRARSIRTPRSARAGCAPRTASSTRRNRPTTAPGTPTTRSRN